MAFRPLFAVILAGCIVLPAGGALAKGTPKPSNKKEARTAAPKPAEAKPVEAKPSGATATPAPAYDAGYDSTRIVHDTPGHNFGQSLNRQFAPGTQLRDKLVAPGVKSVEDAKLIEKLFSQASAAFANAIV